MGSLCYTLPILDANSIRHVVYMCVTKFVCLFLLRKAYNVCLAHTYAINKKRNEKWRVKK